MRVGVLPTLALPVFLLLLASLDSAGRAVAEEQTFELPVQLIGFPVIALSVRLSNFVKKLAYSLNPSTYRSRSRRDASYSEVSDIAIDVSIAEKQIVAEFGPKACILEEPCRIHAARPGVRFQQPDWTEILRNYKVQSTGMKQWYLLSVFLGDVIRNVPLCKQLAKRLECGRTPSHQEPLFIRD
ncbi:unnamed protein product [Hermetia illucens]|uniref:Uncharacterized protein n=1 Tax=Hermetia illucens TaxID=343691 RepID=A0A7R8UKX1_HERIL|nr:uncharacterized protein LOC119650093 [Hermetia illucens]CAD7082768.1 unnamed protein product [Hermetia illucens]